MLLLFGGRSRDLSEKVPAECIPLGRQVHLTDANLPDYLRRRGLLDPDEAVEVQKAGDGNINWVRRARIESPQGKSLVVKQARPALERFPEYEVSTERLVFEARYYEVVRPHDGDGILPVVHGFDEEDRVLVLEDLGDAERLDRALARGVEVSAVATSLGAFLGRIHAATRDPALADRFANDEMRRLHGDHIFVLPLRENDFPLPSELRACADALAADAELVALADAAYGRYLERIAREQP